MVKKCLRLCFAALCAITISAPAQQTHEEEVVRNAYAKLSLLCGLPPLIRAANSQLAGRLIDQATLDADIAKDTPSFSLSDFRVGPVDSIAGKSWGEFFSLPTSSADGVVLQGDLVTYSFAYNGNQTDWRMARIHWSPAPSVASDAAQSMLGLRVSEILKIASAQWEDSMAPVTFPVTYTRYTAFTVEASFQGRTVGPYKAIFLFGNDVHGREFVAQNDPVSGGTPLSYLLNSRVDPSGLMLSKLREVPVVSRWLRANGRFGS